MMNAEAIQAINQGAGIEQADRAIDAAFVRDIGAVVALPNNFELADLERFQTERRRARGAMSTAVLASFAEYVKAHAEPGATVFVDQANMSATAVLNLGDPDAPGHADNLAVLTAKQTAAFEALSRHTLGNALKQSTVAEFLEDWREQLQCRNEAGEVSVPAAIAAIRKLTIEAVRKIESEEKSLSAARSTFEEVSATSKEPIPTVISFACVPYNGLRVRVFQLRLSVQTTGDKPLIILRVIKAEQHAEEMALELAELVQAADTGLPVLVGTYKRAG